MIPAGCMWWLAISPPDVVICRDVVIAARLGVVIAVLLTSRTPPVLHSRKWSSKVKDISVTWLLLWHVISSNPHWNQVYICSLSRLLSIQSFWNHLINQCTCEIRTVSHLLWNRITWLGSNISGIFLHIASRMRRFYVLCKFGVNRCTSRDWKWVRPKVWFVKSSK